MRRTSSMENRHDLKMASFGQQRGRQVGATAQQGRAGDGIGPVAVAHFVQRLIERATPSAFERAARAAPRRVATSRLVTVMPTSVRPRRRIIGMAAARSSRSVWRMGSVAAVASRMLRDRLARVKSANRSRSTTVRPICRLARIRRVTRSTSATSVASMAESGLPVRSTRGLGAERAPPPPYPHRPRIAVVGERVHPPPLARPRISTSADSVSCRRLPHLLDAPRAQLGGGGRTHAPEPVHGKWMQEVQLAARRAPRAARPACPRRWPPWPAARVEATPTVIGRPTRSRTSLAQPRGDLTRRAREALRAAHVEEGLVDRQLLDHRRGLVERPRTPTGWPRGRPPSGRRPQPHRGRAAGRAGPPSRSARRTPGLRSWPPAPPPAPPTSAGRAAADRRAAPPRRRRRRGRRAESWARVARTYVRTRGGGSKVHNPGRDFSSSHSKGARCPSPMSC